MKKLLRCKDAGYALVIVVLVILVTSVLGGAMLTLGAQNRVYAVRSASEVAARCAADAGLTKALYDMNQKLETKPWNDSTLPSATNVALPACDAVYSYTITKSGSGG